MSSPLVNRIADERKKKGWSQRELAERSGLTRSYVSSLERGLFGGTHEAMKSLSDALQVPIGDLFINPDVPGTEMESRQAAKA